MICSILACTPSGGIGNRGSLPWPKNPSDMSWFRKWTLDQIVVMGRNTWDDPMMPKPLPDRVNFVFTNKDLHNLDARRLQGDVNEQLLDVRNRFPDKNIFIIGGKQLYEQTENAVERVYLTRMNGNYFADTRLDLNKYLSCFRLKTVKPGEDCTYEIWDRDFYFS